MSKQPHLLVSEGDLADVALVPGDPGRVDRIAGMCDESTELTYNREYKVVNATYEGRDLTICSTGVGSPSAAVAVEELERVGVETLIRVGTTGALQRGIEIGDMVVATGAAKDEGTTKRYEKATYPAVPDYGVLSALVEAAEANETRAAADASGEAEPEGAGGRVHVGPIATDDAFYAETDEYVDDWERAGLLAVEMEAAAIFSLARRKGMAAGAICTVDGNLVEGTQKGETEDDELPAKAKDNVERAIHIALDATTTL
ncbi:nucleoside phosphorylase [Halorientalis marina]|jgi:uridine phosphorylase|uniref:nucleoside phosphorylase n=1 Tax=Halorientalis marina TaxID=2931976 RepID=UPI001FF359D8|nr:nucleoside phosphorylase [Halorientalis marina]